MPKIEVLLNANMVLSSAPFLYVPLLVFVPTIEILAPFVIAEISPSNVSDP
jgi:hypothetical protein